MNSILSSNSDLNLHFPHQSWSQGILLDKKSIYILKKKKKEKIVGHPDAKDTQLQSWISKWNWLPDKFWGETFKSYPVFGLLVTCFGALLFRELCFEFQPSCLILNRHFNWTLMILLLMVVLTLYACFLSYGSLQDVRGTSVAISVFCCCFL